MVPEALVARSKMCRGRSERVAVGGGRDPLSRRMRRRRVKVILRPVRCAVTSMERTLIFSSRRAVKMR